MNITVAVDEADALDVLLELNTAPGIDAKFVERDQVFDEAKEHPHYYADFAAVAELVVALASSLTSLTALATALMAYRNKKLAKPEEPGPVANHVTVYINGQQLRLAPADTTASVEDKVRVCLEPDRRA